MKQLDIFKKHQATPTEELPFDIDDLSDSVPAHCFSFLFILFHQKPVRFSVGVDRRNGTICIVPLIRDDRYLPAKYISYETMYDILKSDKQCDSDRKYLQMNANNRKEYCFLRSGDRLCIYSYDISEVGCGRRYGTYADELWLHVEDHQYRFSPAYEGLPLTIPFGFFATKSPEKIELFLLEISERTQDIHTLAGQLKDNDIHLVNNHPSH